MHAAPAGPPRHCMVVHARYPLAETRVQRQAEALAAAGWEVDVLCLRAPGEAARATWHGVGVQRLPVAPHRAGLARQLLDYVRFLVLAGARLTRLHLRRPYACVQVHNLPDFLVFCALVPKLQRVPVVLDLHDLMPEFYAGRFGARRPWLARLVRWQERAACHFADHVVTVSEHWRAALIARGVPAARCTVVMNVADERVFTPRRGAPPPRATFRLCYHGALAYRYGLDLALLAVAALRDELPGLRLAILGDGEELAALAELRRRLRLGASVELHYGFVPAEELPAVLADADAGVVPYRADPFTDALLPTKLMEYAALGIPCVAARTSAIAAYFGGTMVEFFTPGDAGDLARHIRGLHDDRARLAALAAGSRAFTTAYNWRSERRRYLALVTGLVESADRAMLAGPGRPPARGGTSSGARPLRRPAHGTRGAPTYAARQVRGNTLRGDAP